MAPRVYLEDCLASVCDSGVTKYGSWRFQLEKAQHFIYIFFPFLVERVTGKYAESR